MVTIQAAPTSSTRSVRSAAAFHRSAMASNTKNPMKHGVEIIPVSGFFVVQSLLLLCLFVSNPIVYL